MKDQLEQTEVEEENAAGARMPVERSVTIHLNGEEVVTIQCGFEHLDELAVGFLVSEGLLTTDDEIQDLKIDREKGLIWVQTPGSKEIARRLVGKRFVTSGCGKGFTFSSVGDAIGIERLAGGVVIPAGRLTDLMKTFLTESRRAGMHASALADSEGIVFVRQDIGRHNTLDMLLGRLFLDRRSTDGLLILTTGRVSYEMVVKAAKARIALVASRTAATDLAVDLAKSLGVEVVGYVRGPRMLVYTSGARLGS